MTTTMRGGGLEYHVDFFVLRVPLLPFAAVERIDRFLEGPQDPRLSEALFLASPELHRQIQRARADDGAAALPPRIERTVIKYLLRMAGRPTPFGLFATWSIGRAGHGTEFDVERSPVTRHVGLDGELLHSIVASLHLNQRLRADSILHPNSSLHRVGEHYHYVEARAGAGRRSHHLIRVIASPYLEAAITASQQGAPLTQIAEAVQLTVAEVDEVEATAFVEQLVHEQILILADTVPALTGQEPVASVAAALHRVGAHVEAAALASVQAQLEVLTRRTKPIAPAEYLAVTEPLAAFSGGLNSQHFIHVDGLRREARAVLGKNVIDELLGAAGVLSQVRPDWPTPLADFRNAFVRRYERQLVPLLEAVDEESGVGFNPVHSPTLGEPDVVRGIVEAGQEETDETVSRRHRRLLSLVQSCIKAAQVELSLSPDDVLDLAEGRTGTLPDAFHVMASLAARSAAHVDRGEFRVIVDHLTGPSGIRLFGRFAQSNAELLGRLRDHVRREECLSKEAVYAEIVHLPEGRISNLQARPLLREFEITYLGASGLPAERQIPASDLLIDVRGGEIRVFSRRLGRRVIPRMSTAHNYTRGLPAYQLLCYLQDADSQSSAWHWGPLSHLPFLPRVSHGKAVLTRARWRIPATEIDALRTACTDALVDRARALRAKIALPRFVRIVDRESRLPLDLESSRCLDVLRHHGSGGSLLVDEMLPDPDELCVPGTGGGYCHELVVPFVAVKSPRRFHAAPRIPSGPRVFLPGSDWRYFRIFSGAISADSVIADLFESVVRPFRTQIISWHFLRYRNPGPHVRFRLRVRDPVSGDDLVSRVRAVCSAHSREGYVHRVAEDTYRRELERYGGDAGIVHCEGLFETDSDAVAACLVDGHALTDEERWMMAIAGIDALWTDFGFTLEGRLGLASRAKTALADRHRFGRVAVPTLARTFRRHRAALESFLFETSHVSPAATSWRRILASRSHNARLAIAQLRSLDEHGNMTTSVEHIATSLAHLHANRMLLNNTPRAEFLLYDLLECALKSCIARTRP